MANRSITYSSVTRAEIANIKAALVGAGMQISPAVTPPPDAGTFSTHGYDVSYAYNETVGTLTVTVSGSLLFLSTACSRLDSYIHPFLVET